MKSTTISISPTKVVKYLSSHDYYRTAEKFGISIGKVFAVETEAERNSTKSRRFH
jgi:hypothetical protein